jgi:hypothetical protein
MSKTRFVPVIAGVLLLILTGCATMTGTDLELTHDDLIFHRRADAGVIAMRSSSRLGYSDLGKNRSRLEAVREAVETP